MAAKIPIGLETRPNTQPNYAVRKGIQKTAQKTAPYGPDIPEYGLRIIAVSIRPPTKPKTHNSPPDALDGFFRHGEPNMNICFLYIPSLEPVQIYHEANATTYSRIEMENGAGVSLTKLDWAGVNCSIAGWTELR